MKEYNIETTDSPAMLAVMKQIMLPEMNALTATDVISGRFSGHIALSEPIIMPSELGLANPQMANVAIAELRSYGRNGFLFHATMAIVSHICGSE